MKTTLFVSLFFSVISLSYSQSKVAFSGSIGAYSIELELEKSTDAENNITGKYRYKGKDVYLDISGNLYRDNVLELEESWNGKVSGTFYLQHEEADEWKGKWIGNSSNYDVHISVVSGDMESLVDKSSLEESQNTSNDITGTYENHIYFLNDMWFSEENPNIEIAVNGGEVAVNEISETEIEVSFELVCGPTYHLAFFSGIAIKNEEGVYVFKQDLWESGECYLTFSFGDKTITLDQHSGNMECGFGARAYASGTYLKVSDEVKEIGE